MLYNLENKELLVSVNSIGAELVGVKNKRDKREIIWSGDKDVWSSTSPLLFPIVGKVKNDCYLHEGRKYHMDKHGFAMKSEFTVEIISSDKIAFSLISSEKTKPIYPFDFKLIIIFEISKNILTVKHMVTNNGKDTMLFSIGAHPGFNCKMGDYLEFECVENIIAYQFDQNKIVKKDMVPFLENEKVFMINKNTFDNDAFILEKLQSTYLYIKSNDNKKSVRVNFYKAPFLGIWAKPNAEFVCIEPWYGVDDSYEEYGELRNKKGIQSLEANENFAFSYEIEV